MHYDYWQKQLPHTPLFPDIAWQKPERKALAGKLLTIGGSAQGFAAVAGAYESATQAGAGECRVLLPDALKKAVDMAAYDCVFVPTNHSGGISRDALGQLIAAAEWADAVLLIGDAGRNSETAIVYEQLLASSPHTLMCVTRDAVDLLKASWPACLARGTTILVVTLAQLQKIFQSVYYPKTILFSMQLTHLVEALHKFTITYPATIVVFHQNQLVTAQAGHVTSSPWEDPMLIWRGHIAARAIVYAMQHKQHVLQAVTTSFVV